MRAVGGGILMVVVFGDGGHGRHLKPLTRDLPYRIYIRIP
jgi:hypothetical protein